MVDDQLNSMAQVQMGLQLALMHTFTCLHHKGVISLDEAAFSFHETEQNLPDNTPHATRMIVATMAKSLQMLAEQQAPPNPLGPPPATRARLQVIRGGRAG